MCEDSEPGCVNGVWVDLSDAEGGDTDPDVGLDADVDPHPDTDTGELSLTITATPESGGEASVFAGETTSVEVRFECGPAECVTECSHNDGAFVACPDGRFELEVGEGEHQVVVRASLGEERVEESTSFVRVRDFGVSLEAPLSGERYYRDLGLVRGACDREDCVLSCEFCAVVDGTESCVAVESCEQGAALELSAVESRLKVQGCVEVAGESYCREEVRSYAMVDPVWTQLSVGGAHSCGILADQSLWCWGSNSAGQLGQGASGGSESQAQRVGGAWEEVSAGREHTCGIQVDGSLWCWGQQEYGRVGNGNAEYGSVAAPQRVGSATDWVEVSAGGQHSCGRRGTNLFCWGHNTGERLGVESNESEVTTPLLVGGGLSWEQVSAGGEHVCGISTQGKAYCWGRGDSGRLGNGADEAIRTSPTEVDALSSWSFLQISAGGEHTCAVVHTGSAGRAYCWGAGSYGRLGTEVTDHDAHYHERSPALVDGGAEYSQVSAGVRHSCGVDAEGRGQCWGSNSDRQLGDGRTGDAASPSAVNQGDGFAWIGTGEMHSCALTQVGEAWCWGQVVDGRLGRESDAAPGPIAWPHGLAQD
ncbi:RCC1 domain-containing protein [Lujinxingia litoralis]|uniref:RCC1 domain-containing protein n=1 Tax=Lujinxingia litoralis TaxID=2211119 RepID=UPI0013146CD0|nr:RCC1 domain-containing protein [Lujinxingia litoralis]